MSKLLSSLKAKAGYKYLQLRIYSRKSSYHIQFRKSPYRILLVLSHMRSGSSLLSHILSTNPEIIGYGETHLSYESENDFKALMFRLYWLNREFKMSHTYIFDKVLHDQKFLNTDFLHSDNVYSIFLLREPQRTIPSILTIKPHLTEEQATDYYIKRLSNLTEYAKLINRKDRSLLISYDQLIHTSDLVFQELQNFLSTKEGFSEKYDVLRTTGMRGIGDSSERLKAGKIIKKEKPLDRQISEELIERARQSFDHCQSVLSQYCQFIK